MKNTKKTCQDKSEGTVNHVSETASHCTMLREFLFQVAVAVIVICHKYSHLPHLSQCFSDWHTPKGGKDEAVLMVVAMRKMVWMVVKITHPG